jgi:fructan beta-fructosidase
VQKSKWVLLNSVGTAMQYFVGSFDGTRFSNENPPANIYRPDSGPDYYAGIVYTHLPSGEEPVLMAWANNWKYANDIPVSPWKGAMALPRRLTLTQDEGVWLLKQHTVASLTGLRGKIWRASQLRVTGKKLIPVRGQQLEMVVKWRPVKESLSGIRLAVGKTNCFSIAYDEKKQSLRIDRAAAGDTAFNKDFSALSNFDAPLKSLQGQITLHIFFDNSLVEVFANDGLLVMTAQLFPDKKNNGIELFSSKGTNIFDKISVWQLKTAW